MSRWRAAGLVALLTVAAYAQAPQASFQFDDWNVILRDPAALSLSGWWSRMPGIRPLLKLSYAACTTLGLGSAGFHAVNVGIHLGCVLLVFMMLERLVRLHGEGAGKAGDVVRAARSSVLAPAAAKEAAREGRASMTAFAGSLLFALHPVQTEAVTYACGRSVSLAALFALGSIVAWLEGRERTKRWLAYVLSPLLAAAAIATKEFTLVILPAILLLVLCDPRRERRRKEAWRALAAHGPVVLAGLCVIAASPVYRRLLATSLAIRDVPTNLRTQASAIVWLGGQLVRPHNLVADPQLPVVTSWTGGALAAALMVTALIVLGFGLVRHRPAPALGILWFFLWLGPTNSFLPRLDVANERQLYVALIGPAWIVGRACARLASGRGAVALEGETRMSEARDRRVRRRARAATSLVLAGAAAIGVATFTRNRVYFTEIGFWEDVVSKAPHNARAHNNLGYAYALVCREADADAAFVTACTLDPSDYTAPINLSMLRDGSLPGYRERCGGHGPRP